MKFGDLIKSYQWLSVQMTLIQLYPDQKEIIDEYEKIFEILKTIDPIDDEMLIVLTEYNTEDNETTSTYVDVSGRKLNTDPNEITDSYAIEFVKWEKWLGMQISPETIAHFNELEIIAHCLFEMTFCGYDEEEIQEQFKSIKKSVDEYKNLSDEEKKVKTISLDDIKKKIDDKGSC